MSKSRDQLIIEACGEGNLDLVKELTDDVDVDEMRVVNRVFFFTPLGAACDGGHLAVVEYLVSERRADVNFDIQIPLSMASTAEIVNFLIDSKADIEGLDKQGKTPLQQACYRNNLVAAKALIDQGANTGVVDDEGNNLLHSCIGTKSEVAMLDYLASKGLDFNLANGKGRTPFYLTCVLFHLDALQYLACKGVNINEINAKSGLTPREAALKSLEDTLGLLGFKPDDPEALNDPLAVEYTEITNSIVRFIDTWNRKGKFVEEVGDFADELWLSNMLFQSYCSGEAMAEPSDQG